MLFANNIYDFSSDKIDIFSINADASSSMAGQEKDMRMGLRMYKESFENFSGAGSIAVSMNTFDSVYRAGAFKHISDFDTSYYTGGATVIYTAIVEGAENLLDYIKKVKLVTGCNPRATFIVLSDGLVWNDYAHSMAEAKSKIVELNNNLVNTVFVAFGDSITSEFGKNMGFMATIDIKDRSRLVSFMGEELSKSCKEQSKSMKSLGAAFFSKANNSKSAEYSSNTSDVLENDDWFL